MNTPDRLSLKSPIHFLKRDVKDLKADVTKLLSSLTKAGVSAGIQNWGQAGKDVIEALTALGLKQDQGTLAWIWIRQAMQKCSHSLCDHNRNLLPENLDFENFEDLLNKALAQEDLFIDNEFCQHFEQHSLTKILQDCFTQWLLVNQVKAEIIAEISKSFNAYFIFNLHQEVKTNNATYQPIEWWTKKLNEKAGDTEKAWLKYGLWLQEQVDEPLFGVEDFSLRQIYISLRAYVVREKKKENQPKNQEKEYERVVVDLHSAIRDWLQQENKRDGLRIICGGPGGGKSSFTKMLAAELAERGNRVLWIPLHLLDPTKDLVKALDELIEGNLDNLYPSNPLKKEESQQRLLVILDGLDELAMQGKLATEVAQQFLQRVKEDLQRFNQSSLRVQILVSGRELVVQHLGEAKDSHQVLHLLPYWLSKEELKKDNYVDDKNLLETDQRQNWWQRYGELKGKNYSGLPKELSEIETLQEITAQPLLNYLVALSYDAGELDFSKKITLNQIYKDLLHRVYKREWAEIQHPTLKNAQITEDQFIQAMAEIAVACWHGNGRTTTVAEIEKHCQHSGIGSVLEVFKTSGSQGVTQLLTAFYFRQQGVQGTEKTFEFTHKSFREYLTVRRIITEIEAIEEELERHHRYPGRGWNEPKCLRRWAVLCGAEAMDHYLFDWLLGEIQLRSIEQVKRWQKLFCDLISYMLRQGMPMEKLDGLTFLQMSQQSRHAEEALLAILNICARVTKIISKIEWENPESFGQWLSKLQGQRIDFNPTLTLSCLSYLDLTNCTLILANLHQANLMEVNLNEANLSGANLSEANLHQANISGANLSEANLERANLNQTILRGANLERANLIRANLEWIYLEESNLEAANLYRANLIGANLARARLIGANLYRANLTEVYMEGAYIRKADVKGLNIRSIGFSQVIWVDDYGNPINEESGC
ncbi:MAG: pentapeptide repeat-containing protein [Snowella sp.]|nr:pentapeptide repeat-containing protein [Snowella sp.]